MPWSAKNKFTLITLAQLLLFTGLNPLYANNFYGINTYYIRYDIKSSNHKITDNRLTMVPAERDYRAEIFSQVRVSALITAGPQESNHTLENLAKKNAFIQVLIQKGLKSVNTMNLDTIISYEGMVCTPVDIWIRPYDVNSGGTPYTADINFASLAFPDTWESLGQKFKSKEILNDFFLLFK